MAAAESALIRRAEDAAVAYDFDAATRWLAAAAQVRERAPSVDDARARIEEARHARIAALHDAALRDLGDAGRALPAGGEIGWRCCVSPPSAIRSAAELRVRLNWRPLRQFPPAPGLHRAYAMAAAPAK